MGSCKQVIEVHGQSLLARVISSVLESRVGEVIVVLGYKSEEVRNEVSDEDVKTVINPDFEKGMNTSLKVGVRKASDEADAVLVVLADQPLLECETINSLVEAYENNNFKIIVPFYKGKRGNPVILDMSLKNKLMNIQGDVGARSIIKNKKEHVLSVEVDTPSVILDVNTEKDLETVRKTLMKKKKNL